MEKTWGEKWADEMNKKNKPTKECKCDKKFRDSTGKCFLCDEKWTKEDKQSSGVCIHSEKDVNKLNILLKEADKEWDIIGKKSGLYDACVDCDIIKYFLHSQIELAYKAGEKNKNAKYDYFKDGYLTGREQTIKQIEEGLPKKIHYYE